MEEKLEDTLYRFKEDKNEFIMLESIKILHETIEEDIKLKALMLLSQIG